MIVGMDFGTTNSGVAHYDGRNLKLLPLDPSNSNPQVARTALYISNNQAITIGREAINRYFDENIGRPVKMKKVWVGEVEVYGADMFYVTDVYAWVDALSPGRLFLSIKSGLRDPEYQGTVVGQYYYSLENLIAIYMNLVKLRSERMIGQEIREIVLGRPVHFSSDPQADALAQQRLLRAAFRAGFTKVYLQYEPIAAAYHYAATIRQPEKILVFDFGGGTLDITVMRLEGQSIREVLATGGVPIAGDVFDQRIVRARLPKHFGEDTYYGEPGRRLPMPRWIYEVFSDWRKVDELQSLENQSLLREIARSAEDRPKLKALIDLISNNYSLQMFDLVESAKRRLSKEMASIIRFTTPDFRITEMLTRSEFEKIIRPEIVAIEKHLDETLAASGLSANEIDAVIRTGGSSTIPAFRNMLVEKFGRDKVLVTDTFSSVTSGLGIIAHGISTGEIDAPAYKPDDLPTEGQLDQRQNVTPVNLGLLKRRLIAQEDPSTRKQADKEPVLLVHSIDGNLSLKQQGKQEISLNSSVPLSINWLANSPGVFGYWVSLDEPLLLVTSKYRFFLTSASELLDLESIGLTVESFFHLKIQEKVTAIGRWDRIKRLGDLTLVTSLGFVRSYTLNGLVESIEGPTPLQFDHPPSGVSIAILGTRKSDNLVIILDSGRAVRLNLNEVPQIGVQAIKRADDERISAAVATGSGDELLLLTHHGFGRQFPADWIPLAKKINSKGRMIVARRPVIGVTNVHPNQPTWLVTNRRLMAFQNELIASDSSDTKRTRRLIKLRDQERLLTFVSP